MGYALELTTGKTLSTTFKNAAEEYLDVKVKNGPSDPVAVTVVNATAGTFHEDIEETVTTPGVPQILVSETVPVATTRSLEKVIVILRQECRWTLTANGSTIASGRTGANHPESCFEWRTPRALAAGTTYELTVLSRSNSAASDVEGYIFSSDTT